MINLKLTPVSGTFDIHGTYKRTVRVGDEDVEREVSFTVTLAWDHFNTPVITEIAWKEEIPEDERIAAEEQIHAQCWTSSRVFKIIYK